MSFLNKLSGLILPKEVDFFGNLHRQSLVTQQVVDSIYHIYIEDGKTGGNLSDVLHNANDMRIKNLLELGEVLITPVDKEAISRTYIQLDWIVLSIKHLDVEISAYKISSLLEYQKIFRLLQKQMEEMSNCFQLLTIKKYKEVLEEVNEIIRLDDELIDEYSVRVATLFNSDSPKHILRHKEILSQLKEVSKRIHFCANTIEDIVFKMH